MQKNVLILITILVLIAFGGIAYTNISNQNNNVSKREEDDSMVVSPLNEEDAESVNRPDDEISLPNMIDHEDTELEVRVIYPNEFTVEKDGPNDLRLVKDVSAMGVGPTNYIYISRVPAETEASTSYLAANPTHLELLSEAEVGDAVVLAEDAQSDFFTYGRVEDIEIDGNITKVFVNYKPWEMPGGTVETVYIVETAEDMYVLGSYTNSGDAYNITSEDAATVINSISFL